MKTFEQKKADYIQLIIEIGLNLQKGQDVIIQAPIFAEDFVQEVSRELYKKGARYIFTRRESEKMNAIRCEYSAEEYLPYLPQWPAEGFLKEVRDNAVVLKIYVEDPLVFASTDSKKLQTLQIAANKSFQDYRTEIANMGCSWTIVSIPQENRANAIFQSEKSEENIQKLRDQIFKITRADQENPLELRKNHKKNLTFYADYLTKKQFRYLHYSSPKTNLKITLPEGHRWFGAGGKNKKGIEFLPNIPTEEVFSLPHKYGVEGTVASTFPLVYAGKLINNFTLTFEQGNVVDFSAEEGYDMLKELLNTDEGARRIGEVAIVPVDSPIAQSGLTFFNTLYDENASCHLALGAAYPKCLPGSEELSAQEKDKKGVNESLIHVDFMIGDANLDIIGETAQGEKIQILSQGKRAI